MNCDPTGRGDRRAGPAGTDELAALLTHVVSAGVSLAIASASAVDLTLAQFRTLAVVAEHAPIRLTALAAKLGIAPSSATQTCDRLVALGLMERSRDPGDQRVARLGLSPCGQALVAEVAALRRRQARDIFERVPPDRRREVLAALACLTEAMGPPAGDHPMFGW